MAILINAPEPPTSVPGSARSSLIITSFFEGGPQEDGPQEGGPQEGGPQEGGPQEGG
ncbi:hypothetical protein MY11210_009459, partial [Beauveria gryllotalpidicola]